MLDDQCYDLMVIILVKVDGVIVDNSTGDA